MQNIIVGHYQRFLFDAEIHPSTGRRYQTHKSILSEDLGNQFNLIGKLLDVAQGKSQKQFQQLFLYGIKLQIWRKDKIKQAIFFVDQNIPTLLWCSSKTKSFLLDLTYTTLSRYDFEVQNKSKVKQYIILRYFQQSLPILFRGEDAHKQFNQIFDRLNKYILHCKVTKSYPPFFSKIIKLYAMEETKQSVVSQKRVKDIIKISRSIGFSDQQLNIKVLQQIYELNNKQKFHRKSLINNEQLNQFFKIINCCQKIKQIFQKYSGQKITLYSQYLHPKMSKKAFQSFLVTQQQESNKIIEEILSQTQEQISFYDFCMFLLSEKVSYICMPEEIVQNLPLTDYYCYSSHNTYLTGNQLTSDSKIQRYLQDLQGGIKCVEIDVHNNGDRPIITHAFKDASLCNPIDFQQTIIAINHYCERNINHYPLILSIQNHTNQQNRYRMYKMLQRILGNKIYVISKQQDFYKYIQMRTLHELRGKIIIKTDSKLEEYKNYIIHVKEVQKELKIQPIKMEIQKFIDVSLYNQKSQKSIKNHVEKPIKSQSSLIPKNLQSSISVMTKITAMFKTKQGINTINSTGHESTSITNSKAIKQKQQKIIDYTKKSWLRIYPQGTQIASSNYDPIPHLKIGAQIIALNTQTKDQYAWLMMSYFLAGRPQISGKIGYVQKPKHLFSKNNEKHVKITNLYQITLLSNTQNIKIKFYGTQSDKQKNINSNLNFIVSDSQFGFLMFKIDNKFRQCVPLRYIRSGYRVLVGKNELFCDSGVRILIHINIKQIGSQ